MHLHYSNYISNFFYSVNHLTILISLKCINAIKSQLSKQDLKNKMK